MTRRPDLSVLDLVPVTSGQTTAQAVANSLDLARACEAWGYRRYWIAEHHLNPGVAGSAPVVAIALVAAATSTIRVGSGAVLAGHYTPLALAEQFGFIDAVHPGRLDLGLGRSASGPPPGSAPGGPAPAPDTPARAANGLPLPAGPPGLIERLAASPRFQAQRALMSRGEVTQSYGDQVEELLALLDGTLVSDEVAIHAHPGEGADVEVWVLGSSGGESAGLAGRLGLPFGANYHVAPQRVVEAVTAYRESFRPSSRGDAPHVMVSADVVVAETDEQAHELATGYGPWVHSIRSAQGAIAYPSPERARGLPWDAEADALVRDRVDTQLVGSVTTVAARLDQLVEATGADELLITTITHDHDDRRESYRRLAEHWGTP